MRQGGKEEKIDAHIQESGHPVGPCTVLEGAYQAIQNPGCLLGRVQRRAKLGKRTMWISRLGLQMSWRRKLQQLIFAH